MAGKQIKEGKNQPLLYSHHSDLSRYSWAVRPPPQDLERSEEARWGITARKSPIGGRFPSVGDEESPADGSFTLYKLQLHMQKSVIVK
ncbi:hypothetical protein [Bacillus sp. AFS018417]|uniref:hypothetical protein n=1 Tax=Bacillus sp. AFS018417 TaxID=2033491 RepID=UPI0015971249|nr:hypothetical protein [Bacillus sp. AFS018417]